MLGCRKVNILFLRRWAVYNKSMCLTIVLSLGLAGIAFASQTFTDATGNHRWDNPDNWEMGVVPCCPDTHYNSVTPPGMNDAYMSIDGTLCVIDETNVGANAAVAYALNVASAPGVENTLHILGGDLYLGGFGLNVGRGSNPDWFEGGHGLSLIHI